MNIQGKTGFAKGLFTAAELDTGKPPPADNKAGKSAHPEDRNERVSFLQKCGDISELALQKPCPINPRETVAGRSPMETNRMLVMFAHSALKYGANCDQLVKKVIAKHAAGSVSDAKPSSRRTSVSEQLPLPPSPSNTTSHSNPPSRPGSMRFPPTPSHPDPPSRPGSMRYPPTSSHPDPPSRPGSMRYPPSSSATGENSSFNQAKSAQNNPLSDQTKSARGNPSSDQERSVRGNPSSDQAKSARRNSSYDQAQSAPGNPPSAPSNSTTSSRRSSTDSASAKSPSEGQDGFVVAVDQACIFKTETTSEPTDSYVKLTYGKTSVNTGVVHFSTKPVYGAEFSFDFNAAAKSRLTVELWEANQVMGDAVLAVGVVEEIGRSKELAVHLKDKDSGVNVSDVFLRVATL